MRHLVFLLSSNNQVLTDKENKVIFGYNIAFLDYKRETERAKHSIQWACFHLCIYKWWAILLECTCMYALQLFTLLVHYFSHRKHVLRCAKNQTAKHGLIVTRIKKDWNKNEISHTYCDSVINGIYSTTLAFFFPNRHLTINNLWYSCRYHVRFSQWSHRLETIVSLCTEARSTRHVHQTRSTPNGISWEKED